MAKKRRKPPAASSDDWIPWSLRPPSDEDSKSQVKGQHDHPKKLKKKLRESIRGEEMSWAPRSPTVEVESNLRIKSEAGGLKNAKKLLVPARGTRIPWAPHPQSGEIVSNKSCKVNEDGSKKEENGSSTPVCGNNVPWASHLSPAEMVSNNSSLLDAGRPKEVLHVANGAREDSGNRGCRSRKHGNSRKRRRGNEGTDLNCDRSFGERSSCLGLDGTGPSEDLKGFTQRKGEDHFKVVTTTHGSRVEAGKVSVTEENLWEEDGCEDGGEDEGEDVEGGGLVIEGVLGNDSHGPARSGPQCTVFASGVGKVMRVGHSTALVVGLEVGERICFLGAVCLRSGRGQAEISGYMIPPGTRGGYLEAHSPRWMSLLVINAVGALAAGPKTRAVTSRVLGGMQHIPLEDEVEIAIGRMAQQFPVVLALRPLPQNELTFLSAQADADALYGGDFEVHEGSAKLAKAIGLSRENVVGLAKELRLPGMQAVLCEAPGLRRCLTPAGWSTAVDAVLHAPWDTSRGFVLVCGAKGVGKSTFCRVLVNQLLAYHPQVAFLDCDVGQPEFTPPGIVSFHLLDAPVLGPPHANIRRPELAYYVGSTTSKPDPMYYSAAVRSLVEHYVSGKTSSGPSEGGAPSPPLVVNTDGWVKGMGRDLLGAVIDVVCPLHIIQLRKRGNSSMQGLDRLPDDCQVHRVQAYVAPPVPPIGPHAPNEPKATDLHAWRLLAYFMGRSEKDDSRLESTRQREQGTPREGGLGIQNGTLRDKQHELASMLAAKRPRRVPWRAVRVSFVVGGVPPNLALHAINGSLVGLVSAAMPPGDLGGGDAGTGSDGLRCLAEAPLAPCLGLGLVRSVDVARQELYVLTPEPLHVLKRVNVLVKGMIQLPTEVLFDPDLCTCPYFSAEGVKGDVQLVRKFKTPATPHASSRRIKRKGRKRA